MSETMITLTAAEHQFLVELLESTQKETRVEEHRTRTLSFREHIIRKEELIDSLLKKLGPSQP